MKIKIAGSKSKKDYEMAKFEAIVGGWVEKEKFRRLKIAQNIKKKMKEINKKWK
jgi:hypothetical protein